MARRESFRKAESGDRHDGLDAFLPWVADWFRREIGDPTPPQEQAWPAIHAGDHVLIHSPTGSGKTFAAFLWALNDLFSEEGSAQTRGVRVLYISPLKALNNDIERNLWAPLAGIQAEAASRGISTREVRAAVRTGDTSPSARAAMVRKPPDILITTPESLYLILTSPKAREILRTVKTAIVDEIHMVCSNKRGVHLSLSLERLEWLAPGFQRIGLSATQRPLEEVARFLGGQRVKIVDGRIETTPRPVSIIDVEYDKKLDVKVLGMPAPAIASPAAGLWPSLIPHVLKDVREHQTTLIFTNSRRAAERAADRLNAQVAIESAAESGESPPVDELAFAGGIFSTGEAEGPFRAHHGSISNEQRREMERDLKGGKLPALIGTSSLELGIDIGSVDLVVQLQSPKSVTQGLQRVGRSGHQVGETSAGKIYATHHEDLFEAVVVAHGMTRREVEEIRTPKNALDILAQQIVAAVSVHDWRVDDLYRAVRGSYAYEGLSYDSFKGVLKLVGGRYPSSVLKSLRARVYWDEINGILAALPGARLHALSNGGAIVDKGEFAVYLPDRRTRIGELDEEFVFETQPGDAFMLGSQVWRATEIDDDRVIVEAAPGAMPRMPFWNGEAMWRPYVLSEKLARFRAELARRIAPHLEEDDDPPDVIEWLRGEYHVDDAGARQLIGYVRRQLRSTGTISSADTIVVETFTDPIGDRRMVVQSPFGGKVNAPWAIALASALRERVGVEPEMQVGDNGILFRFPEADVDLPVDVVASLDSKQVRERLLSHLAGSALFGAVFRRNASRALLLPSVGRGRRTPFWLQRLRAKDLLAVARGLPDFPILLETYRDCLEDEMDLPNLERVVDAVHRGEIKIVHVESHNPSPVAQGLSFGFTSFYLYEWDAPKAERSMQALQLDRAALASLFLDPSFAGVLRPEAISDVVAAVSRTAPGRRARTAVELAQMLHELGDLSLSEARERCEGDAEAWLVELKSQGRVRELSVATRSGPESRWIATPSHDAYRAALGQRADAPEAIRELVRTYLASNAPSTASGIALRYGLPMDLLDRALMELVETSELVQGYFTPGAVEIEWADEHVLARIQARTLALLRAEITPVSPMRYAAEVASLQAVAIPSMARATTADAEGVRSALEQLRGLAIPVEDWISVVLPARVTRFSVADLDSVLRSGDFVWIVAPSESGTPRVRFFPRGSGGTYLSDAELGAVGAEPDGLSKAARRIWEFLKTEGVASSSDLRGAMAGTSLMDLRAGLRELVVNGLVTADSWSALPALLTESRSDANGARRPYPERHRTSGHRALAAGRRDAARRIREATRALPPETRWSTAARYAVLGSEVSAAERAAARAGALLGRHGVVSRQAVEMEGNDWAWGPIVSELSLMELRGTARRGYFVDGLPGLQFAMPRMVERLRAPIDRHQLALLQARDPANVLTRAAAELIPGPDARLIRFSRVPSTYIALAGDRPLLLAEENGERISASTDPGLRDQLASALALLRDRRISDPAFGSRMTVVTWNGEATLESDGAEILAAAGFRQDYPGMTYDALQARATART